MSVKIKGVVGYSIGDTIPESADFSHIEYRRKEVGYDPSVPFGEGATYENIPIFYYVVYERLKEEANKFFSDLGAKGE